MNKLLAWAFIATSAFGSHHFSDDYIKKQDALPKVEIGFDNSSVNVTDDNTDLMEKSTHKVLVETLIQRRNPNYVPVDPNAPVNPDVYVEPEFQQMIIHGHGSGVIVSNRLGKLQLFTCNHVTHFKPPFGVTVINISIKVDLDGFLIPCNIVATDKELDISLIEIKGRVFSKQFRTITNIASDKSLRRGDRVYTVGFPEDKQKTMTSGIVSGTLSNIYEDEIGIFTIGTAAVSRGNSGGPLFTFKDGEVYLAGISRLMFETGGIYGYVPPHLIHKFIMENKLQHLYKK